MFFMFLKIIIFNVVKNQFHNVDIPLVNNLSLKKRTLYG